MTTLELNQPRDAPATTPAFKTLRPRVSVSAIENKENLNLTPITRRPRRMSSALAEASRLEYRAPAVKDFAANPSDRAVLLPSSSLHSNVPMDTRPVLKVLTPRTRNVSFLTPPSSTTTTRISNSHQPSKESTLTNGSRESSAIRHTQYIPSLSDDFPSIPSEGRTRPSASQTPNPIPKKKAMDYSSRTTTSHLSTPLSSQQQSFNLIPNQPVLPAPSPLRQNPSRSDIRSQQSLRHPPKPSPSLPISPYARPLPTSSSQLHSKAADVRPKPNPNDSFLRAGLVAKTRQSIPPITTFSPSSAPSTTFMAGSMFVAETSSPLEQYRSRVPPPLRTTGLPARKHSTQHGDVEILPGERGLLLDLRVSERRAGRIGDEILRISSDGNAVSTTFESLSLQY